MLLVIFIHTAAECVTLYRTDSIQFAVMNSAHRLSSFVVQGFIFLSGLKLFINAERSFSYVKFCLSRIRRVVIPYVVVFSVFVLYFILTNRIKPDAGYIFTELITGGLVGHFYFVAIICQFYLLMPLWRVAVKRCDPIIAIFTSLMVMLILRAHLPELLKLFFSYEMKYNSRLFTTYLFYFICGAFAGRYYERFYDTLVSHRRGIFISCIICGITDCILIWVIRRGLYYPIWADDFHVLYCSFAILASLSLCMKLTKVNSSKTVSLLSKVSYNVYLIHPLFIFLADSIMDNLGVSSLSIRFIIKSAVTLISSLSLCLAIGNIKIKKVR